MKKIVFWTSSFLAIIFIVIILLICRFEYSREEKYYSNAWVLDTADNKCHIFYEGEMIELDCKLSDNGIDMENVIADIKTVDNCVVSMAVKNSRISNKILAVSKDYIEVEGYGKVPLNQDYKVYNNADNLVSLDNSAIIVGYDNVEFVVGDGEICAAIVLRELEVKDVRVLLMNTGYESIFHDIVRVRGTDTITVESLDKDNPIDILQVDAGKMLVIDKDSGKFDRVRITAKSGEIEMCSIERSQGNPSYQGSIEVVWRDEGFVIINEVEVEDYLKRVVPSEMPANYGVEALKVQAICARSYAYRQLDNDTYGEYGAHMDDSIQYQVYNNTTEKATSNEAIEKTRGQVLEYDGEIVKTFYYSTSCGTTSDLTVWGSDPEAYPYYKPIRVKDLGEQIDYSDNGEFENLIKNQDKSDYDYEYSLYRWKVSNSLDSYSQSVRDKIVERNRDFQDKVMLEDIGGKITDINVNCRSTGGACLEVVVNFEQGRAIIEGENNVRYIFGFSDSELKDKYDQARYVDSLPSAYCIFELKENAVVITGGGYGHGIGMSQNAVNSMVDKGLKYQDILSIFYPGTKIVTMGL